VGNTKELTHISLCAGYGGIDLGLSRAINAIRTVCFVEIEAFAIENLVSKVEAGLLDPAPIFTDLKKFPWELFANRVDVLSGGFPCQPFSAAGRRSGDDDPRHLWPYITDGIKRLGRPAIVFFENVEGIISSKLKSDDWSDPKGTSVLLHVLRELERLGYDAEAGVFSASEVGAPHQRKRVFIMGVRSDLGESGRALVSGLLERGRELRVGNSESWDGSSPLWGREPELEGVQLPLRESGTAYPAPRGAEQYPFEPPRVTQLGDTNSGNKRSHGREPRILSQTVCDRETDRHQRTSLAGTVGDTYEQGLQGDVSTMDSGRPHAIDKVTTSRSSAHGNIQGETEPSMGRNVDGPSCGMGYAELQESLDNRTDELRLLGNGVVPDTAERAFRELWRDLNT
jgi:DNA (cytosine-5)-methyltransferase 1